MADNIEVGNLVAKISFDDTGLAKSMAQIDRQMKLVKSEFDKAASALKGYGSEEEKLKNQAQGLNQQMQLQQQRINKLNEEFQRAAREKGEDARETQNLAVKLNQAQTAYNNLENELKQVNVELEKQQKLLKGESWTKMGEQLSEVGNKFKDVGQQLTNVGKDLSMKVTAPIVGLGAASAKAAIDFESAFAGMRKTIDASEEKFAELEKGVRDMAKVMPATASEIAAVGEAAGQLGIETDNILSFTEVMIGLGEATNLSADQAATELARLANITQMPQTEFEKLGSSVVALGNSMATTEAEIVSMSLRLAAQGKQVGMSEADIMALAGTMSALGIEAEAGGTAMTMVLKKIQTAVADGAGDLELFAKAANMSGEAFAESFINDPVMALDALVKGLNKSSSEGANLTSILDDLGIKGIREADTLLRMSGASDLLAEAVANSNQAWEENVALTNEVSQRYATTESQLAMFRNRLVEVGMQIGEILIPLLMKVVDAISPWIERFGALDESTQKVILAIAGVAAAIGPLLVIGGQIASGIGSIISVVGSLSTAIGAAGGASAVFGSALAAITGPVGIAVAAITGIVTTLTVLTTFLISVKAMDIAVFIASK